MNKTYLLYLAVLIAFVLAMFLVPELGTSRESHNTKKAERMPMSVGRIPMKHQHKDHRHAEKLPPAWRTFLEICSHEQPKPGLFNVKSMKTPNWKQTKNHSYPGGCGMTIQNYRDIKLKGWPASMADATPAQQLWASHRLFWKYARIGQKMLGSYERGQRYGATVWAVTERMGFNGFKKDGRTWQS